MVGLVGLTVMESGLVTRTPRRSRRLWFRVDRDADALDGRGRVHELRNTNDAGDHTGTESRCRNDRPNSR